MQIANCPSCGAAVKFQSAASVLAVCEYCASTLLRRGAVLEDIGKMASLMDDPTLIRVGSEGGYKGARFAVIGRLQMRYEAGLWNEWHILFDDMRTGWLGESAGEFFVTFERQVDLAPPPFSALNIEDRVELGGRYFEVSNLESATCIAGEGELPFHVGAGFEAPVADLRLDEEFATIDYSDVQGGGPARVYVGERVAARDLKLSNLRDAGGADSAAAPTASADAFNCPACAAPFTLSSGRIKSFGCTSCGALLDTGTRQVQLVMKAQAAMETPLHLPLGSTGTLGGTQWKVIGHLRRASEDGFAWSEYLLFEARAGFAWLIESDGHWTFARNADKPLKRVGTLAFHGKTSYEHFSHYLAEVTHVDGECYWKVRAGDTVEVDDFVAPPAIASREKDGKELTWTIGQYLAPAVVQKAFSVATPLPPPRGVAPNQPSPWKDTENRLWKRFALFAVLALALQLWFAITTTTVKREQVSFSPGAENSVTTAPFAIAGNGPLAVATETNLDNAWAGLGYTLVDATSGHVWRAEQTLESWSGVDEDGDRWSEGERSGLVTFGKVPAGTYRLQVEGELAPDAKGPMLASLKLERGHASWLNWLLLELGLLSVPVFAWWRARAFEAARWSDSDRARDDDDEE